MDTIENIDLPIWLFLFFHRYVDLPEGAKPDVGDTKFYNNPAYEKKKKNSSRRKKDTDEDDMEHYYTYPKHQHATENRYEKRPPLPSEKGKIKSGKEKIKKKSKDKKKKKKLDPSLYGQAFHNRAFEDDDGSGTVKSTSSGIYESIRDPDPSYLSLDRDKVDKNGTAHSNHGYMSIDKRKGDGEQSNFEALRAEAMDTEGSRVSNSDDYLEPATLRREEEIVLDTSPDERLETPQANPLFQGIDEEDDAGYDKAVAFRQDSGYHSQKPSQRTRKSYPQQSSDKSRKMSEEEDISPYAEYFPIERKHTGVFSAKRPEEQLDPYGSGSAVFQASGSQKNPLYKKSGDSRGGSRYSRSSSKPGNSFYGGSKFGDLKEEQTMYIDLPRDPGDLNTLYDRADNLVHNPHPLTGSAEGVYDKADGFKPRKGESKRLRRYDDDLNVIYDKADGVKVKSPKRSHDKNFNDLYDRADGYHRSNKSKKHKNSDFDDLYDRADGVTRVKSKRADDDLHGLYDRADSVIPRQGSSKRLPRQPLR